MTRPFYFANPSRFLPIFSGLPLFYPIYASLLVYAGSNFLSIFFSANFYALSFSLAIACLILSTSSMPSSSFSTGSSYASSLYCPSVSILFCYEPFILEDGLSSLGPWFHWLYPTCWLTFFISFCGPICLSSINLFIDPSCFRSEFLLPSRLRPDGS